MITFDPNEKEHITTLLRDYLQTELGVEIGRFDAEFLLDFVTAKIGAHYYNRGLLDAQAAMMKRIDEIGEAIYALEQPTT
jgi:uncharacterized protein (DUF2164 family)